MNIPVSRLRCKGSFHCVAKLVSSELQFAKLVSTEFNINVIGMYVINIYVINIYVIGIYVILPSLIRRP
jgi:hypothetical protein